MRLGLITDSIEKGPTSIGNYTKALIQELLKLRKEDIELILIHSQKSRDPIYKKAKEIVGNATVTFIFS